MKASKLQAVLLTVLALCCALMAESKYILSSKRLSSTEIGVSCNNGGDPTGKMIGNTLIISCGK